MNFRSRPERRAARPRTLAWTALLGLVCVGAMSAGQEGELGVGEARSTLERWVEVRRVLSQEKRDWALGKEMLEERIDVVQREIEGLRTEIGSAEESIAEADRKRAELQQDNQRLIEASSSLLATATQLEERTRALLPRLPDPIRERVKPLSQRIPDDPETTKLSLSERFQNVVGILNEINKFNRDINVTSEVRTLPDGTSAEVTAMYVGVGQGFYVTGDGKAAGIGASTTDGWAWTAADEAAAEVARAIAILKNEQAADFVLLPVRIDQEASRP